MQAIHWKTAITAGWGRALFLRDIRAANGGLCLKIEEESGTQWAVDFQPVQAWKVTTEECAGTIVSLLPAEGALFLMQDSSWLQELGEATPLENSKHFVICCYDEIVEILAWDHSIIEGAKP